MGSRVVSQVVDLENLAEAARRVLQLVQVERLWLVELVPVRRPHLVGVLVLLSPPRRTVPQLTIALVTSHERSRGLVDAESPGVVEDGVLASVASPEVGPVVAAGVSVTGPKRGVLVLTGVRLHVRSGLLVGATAESARRCFEVLIEPRVEREAEPTD